MVRDDLDETVRSCRQRLDPVRKSDMEIRPATLRQLVVGDIPDEDVLERELALGSHSRNLMFMHEISALACSEMPKQFALLAAVALQARDGAGPENRADDRSVLSKTFLRRRELVEAGDDQALQARGNGQVGRLVGDMPAQSIHQSTVTEHLHGLLDEERVSAGASQQPGRRLRSS